MAKTTKAKAPARPAKKAKPPPAVTSIADLTSDPRNARRHTPRNVGAIVNSLHAVGAARSIVIDEDNVILAGNATVEAAGEAGIERVKVVEADGNTIVAVRRTGLTREQKVRLAVSDNRASELAEWEPENLAALMDECRIDPRELDFLEAELDRIVRDAAASGENPGGASEPGDAGDAKATGDRGCGVFVVCADEADQQRVYDELTAGGYTCRVGKNVHAGTAGES